jgi:hypothetical protein
MSATYSIAPLHRGGAPKGAPRCAKRIATKAPISVKCTDGSISETFRVGTQDYLVQWVQRSGGVIQQSNVLNDIRENFNVISPSEFSARFGQ